MEFNTPDDVKSSTHHNSDLQQAYIPVIDIDRSEDEERNSDHPKNVEN
jgi:hypothetical protein